MQTHRECPPGLISTDTGLQKPPQAPHAEPGLFVLQNTECFPCLIRFGFHNNSLRCTQSWTPFHR